MLFALLRGPHSRQCERGLESPEMVEGVLNDEPAGCSELELSLESSLRTESF